MQITTFQSGRHPLVAAVVLAVLGAVLALGHTACGGSEAAPGGPAPAQSATTSLVNAPASSTFVYGVLLAGSYEDQGWSQANYEGGLYVQSRLPGAVMVYYDKVNPSDRAGVTAEQLAEDLVKQGAKIVFFTSADMEEAARSFATKHPAVAVVHTGGHGAWVEGKGNQGLPNLSNVMGRMEYGEMMAGFVAALTTNTGKIAFLGATANDQTRRLAASAYLGAKYAWTQYLHKDPAQLTFTVGWTSGGSNAAAKTPDPAQVVSGLCRQGCDVVISGLDGNDGLVEVAKIRQAGNNVWAIPYVYDDCLEASPTAILGVPSFNWGPSYLEYVAAVRAGQWTSFWQWKAPDWNNINDPDGSAVGFKKGAGLSSSNSKHLDTFMESLSKGLNLWTGPLNLEDGSPYLKTGERATDQQIWYLPQLLQGMHGQSAAQ